MTTEADKPSPSDFIRSCPPDMKSADVHKKGQEEGLDFSLSLVSAVRRYEDRKKQGLNYRGTPMKRGKKGKPMRPTDFIRAHPDMDPKPLQEAGKARGIHFALHTVHTTRHNDRKKVQGPAAAKNRKPNEPFDDIQFVRARAHMTPKDIEQEARNDWGVTLKRTRIYNIRNYSVKKRSGQALNGQAARVARAAPGAAERRQGPPTHLERLSKRAEEYEAKAAAIRLTIRIMKEGD